VVLRTDGDPAALAGSVRAIVRRLDATMPVRDLATMEERVHAAQRSERFRAVLVGALGVLALALSVIGIYGVVSYTACPRTIRRRWRRWRSCCSLSRWRRPSCRRCARAGWIRSWRCGRSEAVRLSFSTTTGPWAMDEWGNICTADDETDASEGGYARKRFFDGRDHPMPPFHAFPVSKDQRDWINLRWR